MSLQSGGITLNIQMEGANRRTRSSSIASHSSAGGLEPERLLSLRNAASGFMDFRRFAILLLSSE